MNVDLVKLNFTVTFIDHLKIKKEEVLVDIEYFGQGIFGTDLDVADFSKNVTDDFSKVRIGLIS